MKRAWIPVAGIAALVAGVYALNAQQVSAPLGPAGMACAYNASPPTLTTGNAGWVQCDSTGKLITSGGGGGGDATAANQTLQITQETLTNTNLSSLITAVGSAIPTGTNN